LFGMVMYWYNSQTFFSGQTIFVDYYMSGYNVLFVALPIIIVGAIDEDLPDTYSKEFPQLYRQGQRNEYFDIRVKVLWMANAMYQSVILFLIPTYSLYLVAQDKNGREQDMWALGTTIYTCVVLSVNLEAAMIINYWTWIHHLCIWGSIILWFIFLLVWGAVDSSNSTYTYYLLWEVLGPAPAYWLIVVLTVTLCLLPDAVFRAFQRVYCPQDHHIIQAIMLARSKKKYIAQGRHSAASRSLDDSFEMTSLAEAEAAREFAESGVPEILEEEINREAGAEERKKEERRSGRMPPAPSNFSRETDSDEGSSSNESEDARMPHYPSEALNKQTNGTNPSHLAMRVSPVIWHPAMAHSALASSSSRARDFGEDDPETDEPAKDADWSSLQL